MLDMNGDLDVSWTATQYDDTNDVLVNNQAVVTQAGPFGKIYASYNAGGKVDKHVVEVTATDGEYTLAKKFAVNVRTINDDITPTYKVELSDSVMDLNPEVRHELFDADSNVEARVAEYFGTVFAGYVGKNSYSGSTLDKITVKKSGKYFQDADLMDVTTTSGITSSAVNVGLTNGVLDLQTIDNNANNVYFASGAEFNGSNCVAANGTYTVTATVNAFRKNAGGNFVDSSKDVAATANFTVKNTAEMPKLTVLSLTGEGVDPETLVEDCVAVDVNVLNWKDAIAGVYGKDCSTKLLTMPTNNKVTVKYVEVTDTFGGITYHYFVPVSRTFKLK